MYGRCKHDTSWKVYGTVYTVYCTVYLLYSIMYTLVYHSYVAIECQSDHHILQAVQHMSCVHTIHLYYLNYPIHNWFM